MNVKIALRNFLFKNSFWIERLNNKSDLIQFISDFREHYISCDLIRVGGNGDGGYLMPDILSEVNYCFSPGVSDTADFEKEISEKFNIQSFLADASVDGAPEYDVNFKFTKKFLGAKNHNDFITLADWMASEKIEPNKKIILQMDIEGSEYEVLIVEEVTTLAKFSVMIIEFHSFQKLFEKDFLKMVSAVFQKLYKEFSICHVHPNNCCGVASLHGIDIPRVMEITFLRNDLVENFKNSEKIKSPHPLDSKNVDYNEDIILPHYWKN